MRELGSSNAVQNQDMARTNRAKEGDADMEDDSDHGLDIWNGVDTGFNPRGGRRSEEVEQERCWGSDMVVAESRSGVELAMGMGNNNIRSPTNREECWAMMDLGKHNVGSEAAISGTRQSMDDQLLTPGYVRNLDESSLNRPRVQIEVVLGLSKELCQGYGLKEIQKSQNRSKDQISNIKEGGVAAGGTVESSPSASEAQELEPSLLPAQNKKGKKKVSFSAKHGFLHPKKGPFSLLRRYGYRGASTSKAVPKAAVWRAAVATISLSASVENGSDKGRHILTEAQATLKIGEVLGVNYNGTEDKVLHQIVELELKDKFKMGKYLIQKSWRLKGYSAGHGSSLLSVAICSALVCADFYLICLRPRSVYLADERNDLCNPFEPQSNRLVWHYSKNGVYIVNIGYLVALVMVPCVENSDRDLQEEGKEPGRKAWKPPIGLCKYLEPKSC
ncbi:hypothetical protein TEA_028484 [Camellia sinensis var. sinensis]|uniref:Uncharacterized protein n=1 Tax=Camellia sinensis var. sinensis TaxID=542762 RepID=A0A4S4ESC9_CAMSN|nr:hypothetical protein TEA_028484 [Camellia sinensis var. sinensis]